MFIRVSQTDLRRLDPEISKYLILEHESRTLGVHYD